MTTTWVSTNGPKRGKAATFSLKSNGSPEVWEYDIKFSDDQATAYDAQAVSGIPSANSQIVSPIAGTLNQYANEWACKQNEKDGRYWRVSVSFAIPDPQIQPPKPSGYSSGDKYGTSVTGNSVPIQEPMFQDSSGFTMCKTTNEPFDPQPTQLVYDECVKVSFWSDKIDFTNLEACEGKANSASITMTIGSTTKTFATNTLKLDSWSWEDHRDATGVVTFHITYDLMYRPTTWVAQYPNQSFYFGSGYSGYSGGVVGDDTHPLIPITDNRNPPQPVASPRYIGISGATVGMPLPNGVPCPMLTRTPIYTTSFSSLLTGIP